MPAVYSMPSDQAYRTLGVLEAGQRWFSFDVRMGQARKGSAKRFGMTLWNFHTRTGTREFEAWAITRDSASGAFWYGPHVRTAQGSFVTLLAALGGMQELCAVISRPAAPPSSGFRLATTITLASMIESRLRFSSTAASFSAG